MHAQHNVWWCLYAFAGIKDGRKAARREQCEPTDYVSAQVMRGGNGLRVAWRELTKMPVIPQLEPGHEGGAQITVGPTIKEV